MRIVVLDEQKATFAKLLAFGVEFDFEIENEAGGKKDEKREERTKEYFKEIAKKLVESKERLVVAGPGFSKDNLKKYIEEKNPGMLKKIVFETCSTAERTGVIELLKSGKLAKIAGEERVAKEFEFVETLLEELRKDSGLAVYGKIEVHKAAEYGALKELFVLDELLRKDKGIESLVEKISRKGIRTTVFSSENDAGKQLEGLGGLAGILKFRVQ